MQVEHIYLGDRKLSVRTSVLEEKATACTMLCCYADELKEGFYPYVEQVSSPSSICITFLCSMWPCTEVPACSMHCKHAYLRHATVLQCLMIVTTWIILWHPMCPHSNRPLCVLQVTGIMLPLLKFYFQEEVRQAAVQSIPDLLRSAYLAAQKGMQGADANYVRRMVDFIWGPLVEAIGKVLPPCMPCLGLGLGLAG